jgi:integrase
MAKTIHKLKPLALSKLKAGFHSDGGNLYIRVKESGARSWVFRYKLAGQVKELGLGSLNTVTILDARKFAKGMNQFLLLGKNPALYLKADSTLELKTFKERAIEYIESKRDGWRNAKHAAQWLSTLEEYAYPKLGKMYPSEITLADVLSVLTPIWKSKTETASRLRGRIESILSYAAVSEQSDRRNPARWKGNLDMVLPKPDSVTPVKHHPSLKYLDLPLLMSELRQKDSISAYCLRFTVLTSTRSGEARGALWSEIDLDNKVWEIPASRMKAKKPHKVPLNNEAIEILEKMKSIKHGKSDLVFNNGGDKVISDVSVSKALKSLRQSITVHGFRSTFRVWGAETTSIPRVVLEFALAHNIQDETEGAYQRSDLFERRRELMNIWGNFCKDTSNIVKLLQSA